MSFDALGENFGALIKLVRRPIYLRSPLSHTHQPLFEYDLTHTDTFFYQIHFTRNKEP